MNTSKSEKCAFCNFEKGHTIDTCSYSILRAKELHKELIYLITYRVGMKPEPCWYVHLLMQRYMSKRDLDALISFHYSKLQQYMNGLIEDQIIIDKQRKLENYQDKLFIVSFFYYDNVANGIFKLAEADIPKKKFKMKTRTISKTHSEPTFDCPVCLSTVKNELCGTDIHNN
jgi:hypothetical protein